MSQLCWFKYYIDQMIKYFASVPLPDMQPSTHTNTQLLCLCFIGFHAQTADVLPQALSDAPHWSPWSGLPHSTLPGIIHLSHSLWLLHHLFLLLKWLLPFTASLLTSTKLKLSQKTLGYAVIGSRSLSYDSVPGPHSLWSSVFDIGYFLGKFCDSIGCTFVTLSCWRRLSEDRCTYKYLSEHSEQLLW